MYICIVVVVGLWSMVFYFYQESIFFFNDIIFINLKESKKWQERMEMLEALNKLVSNPKLEPGQYGEICAVLKKVNFNKLYECTT